MDTNSGVYRITNLVNSHSYVGSSRNLKRRRIATISAPSAKIGTTPQGYRMHGISMGKLRSSS